jgi:GMP synthase-like glutamine amidotransferase
MPPGYADSGMSANRQARLWVIDPSIHEAEDQCVQQVLDGWPGVSRVFHPSLRPGDGPSPDAGYEIDGAVVLGSSASVHDDLPWLRGLSAWLGPLLDGSRRIPVMGICFGHQLVAHLAGGKVGFLRQDHRKLLGAEETRFEGSRLLPGTHRLRVLVSHREVVDVLPAGYRVVARRREVAADAFEHEELPVYGVQFHPEARDEFAGRRGLDPSIIDARLVADSDRVLAAFRDHVLRDSRASSSFR